jgi:hypothetical protein
MCIAILDWNEPKDFAGLALRPYPRGSVDRSADIAASHLNRWADED